MGHRLRESKGRGKEGVTQILPIVQKTDNCFELAGGSRGREEQIGMIYVLDIGSIEQKKNDQRPLDFWLK
mgnify:CR=1 FL=1